MSQTQKLLAQLRSRQQKQQVQTSESQTSSSHLDSQATISNCAKLFLLHPRLCFSDWRVLAEYLGGYEYILPAKRDIIDALAVELIKLHGIQITRHKLYTVESCFSDQTQKDCLKWIQDLNN